MSRTVADVRVCATVYCSDRAEPGALYCERCLEELYSTEFECGWEGVGVVLLGILAILTVFVVIGWA